MVRFDICASSYYACPPPFHHVLDCKAYGIRTIVYWHQAHVITTKTPVLICTQCVVCANIDTCTQVWYVHLLLQVIDSR